VSNRIPPLIFLSLCDVIAKAQVKLPRHINCKHEEKRVFVSLCERDLEFVARNPEQKCGKTRIKALYQRFLSCLRVQLQTYYGNFKKRSFDRKSLQDT